MSPEQAEGKLVDHRSDIFSIGVLLYELATGRRPFTGDTNMSVLSSLLKDTPKPVSDINPSVPASIARVLRSCLQKDPERRYQSVKDLRNELRTIREEIAAGDVAPAPAVATRRTPAVVPILGGLLIAALAAIGYLLIDRGRNADAVPSLRHRQITAAAGSEIMPNLSPDAKWLVYVAAPSGNPDIFLQAVNGQTAINLTKDSPAIDIAPVFSPDGERIVFRSSRDGGGLYVMGRTGEAPRRLSSDGVTTSWSPDGSEIVFATASASDPINRSILSSLRVIRVDTGATRVLIEADGMNPDWSPNGQFIAYWGLTSNQSDTVRARDLWVIPAAGGTPWRVTDDPAVDWCPQWSPDGRFLLLRERSRRHDERVAHRHGSRQRTSDRSRTGGADDARTFRGRPRRLEKRHALHLHVEVADQERAPARLRCVASEPGTCRSADVRYEALVQRRLIVRRDAARARLLSAPRRHLHQPRGWIRAPAAHDRRALRPISALVARRQTDRLLLQSQRQVQVWTVTLGGELRQLTEAADYSAIYPRWSPDGRRMLFEDGAKGVLVLFDPWKPWRNQQPDVLPAVPRSGSGPVSAPLWSPDGTKVALSESARVLIYDVAKRTYEPLADTAGFVELASGRPAAAPSSDGIGDLRSRQANGKPGRHSRRLG